MSGRQSEMNPFKKDLEDELQAFSLSDEKKRLIAKEVRKQRSKSVNGSSWSYRFALATFMIFSLSFGFLLVQQENRGEKTGATIEPDVTSTFLNLFASDWMKGLLLISIFISIRFFVQRTLIKKGKNLPTCIECGEEWSYREALKMSMKNELVTCPNCGKKQYKTRKSSMKASMLNFLIPLGILIAQAFDHILFGYLLHATGTLWLIITLTPYLIEFQEDDPITKPLY